MAKKSSSKKLEQLRRTQEITDIVERGNIEEQALSDSASSQGVSDEQHVTDLLKTAQDEEEKSERKDSRLMKRISKSKKASKPSKKTSKPKRSKPKKKGRR